MPKTSWKLSVRFPDYAYSIESHKDQEHTPETLLAEIEEFAARVRRDIAKYAAKDPQ